MLRCCVLYNKSFHFLRAVAYEILGFGQTVQHASSKTVEYGFAVRRLNKVAKRIQRRCSHLRKR